MKKDDVNKRLQNSLVLVTNLVKEQRECLAMMDRELAALKKLDIQLTEQQATRFLLENPPKGVYVAGKKEMPLK